MPNDADHPKWLLLIEDADLRERVRLAWLRERVRLAWLRWRGAK